MLLPISYSPVHFTIAHLSWRRSRFCLSGIETCTLAGTIAYWICLGSHIWSLIHAIGDAFTAGIGYFRHYFFLEWASSYLRSAPILTITMDDWSPPGSFAILCSPVFYCYSLDSTAQFSSVSLFAICPFGFMRLSSREDFSSPLHLGTMWYPWSFLFMELELVHLILPRRWFHLGTFVLANFCHCLGFDLWRRPGSYMYCIAIITCLSLLVYLHHLIWRHYGRG